MNVEQYVLSLKKVGVGIMELDFMDIGCVLDIFTEYLHNNGTHEKQATQSDFDKF